MDDVTRSEVEKLHERITRLRERVVNLEAQQPHINAALIRIEGNIEKMVAKFDRAKWAILTPIIALLVGVAFKFLTSGTLAGF